MRRKAARPGRPPAPCPRASPRRPAGAPRSGSVTAASPASVRAAGLGLTLWILFSAIVCAVRGGARGGGGRGELLSAGEGRRRSAEVAARGEEKGREETRGRGGGPEGGGTARGPARPRAAPWAGRAALANAAPRRSLRRRRFMRCAAPLWLDPFRVSLRRALPAAAPPPPGAKREEPGRERRGGRAGAGPGARSRAGRGRAEGAGTICRAARAQNSPEGGGGERGGIRRCRRA